jgi:hypothetical protein
MTWNELVNDFERICVLKTCLYYRIDENYLTLDDLLEIREIAHVELEIIKLLPIYKDDLHGTLNLWRAQVYKEFERLQKEVYNGGR